jgi:hypothetical protein
VVWIILKYLDELRPLESRHTRDIMLHLVGEEVLLLPVGLHGVSGANPSAVDGAVTISVHPWLDPDLVEGQVGTLGHMRYGHDASAAPN